MQARSDHRYRFSPALRVVALLLIVQSLLSQGALLAQGTEPAKIIAYTYDKVGNRLTRVETRNPGASQSVLTTSYSYTRTAAELPSNSSDIPDLSRYANPAAYAASYALNDWLWKEVRPDNTSVYYDYNANGAQVRESRYTTSTGVFTKRSDFLFTFDGKLSAQLFFEPGTLMLATSQVLYNYDGDGNRIGLERDVMGTVGGSYGVVGRENHQYLVDTSQPYAEVIQEAAWSSNGAGVATSPTVMTRYDLGLDRLRLFQYQVNANAPPTSLASSWFVFDGLGSTRGLLDDGGVGVGEFGYVDAFGIPYQLAANGSRSVAGSGFFLSQV